MESRDLLVLNYGNFYENLENAFEQLSASDALRKSFIENPARIINDLLFPGMIIPPESKINQANRTLFSLLSNKEFMKWAQEFQNKLNNKIEQLSEFKDKREACRQLEFLFDKKELYIQVMEGLLKYGDIETLFSINVIDKSDQFDVRTPSFPRIGSKTPNTIESIQKNIPSPMSVALEIETVAVAVFVLIVFFIDLTPVQARTFQGLTRIDLQPLLAFLSKEINKRANDVRNSGALTSLNSLKKGSVI